jgi:hypothetical protein
VASEAKAKHSAMDGLINRSPIRTTLYLRQQQQQQQELNQSCQVSETKLNEIRLSEAEVANDAATIPDAFYEPSINSFSP